MNNILQLKGPFQQQSGNSQIGPPSLPKGKFVTSNHLRKLKSELEQLLLRWKNDTIINGALVSVYYYHVVAKSNRIDGLLCKGNIHAEDSIRGSKFYGNNPIQHVFTHFVKLDILEESIKRLGICINIVDKEFSGEITCENVESINLKRREYTDKRIAKTNFLKIIKDACYVDKFDLDQDRTQQNEMSIVTLYRTDIEIKELLRKFGISTIDAKLINKTTVRLNPDELKTLKDKASYLISMKTFDLTELKLEQINPVDNEVPQIPPPNNEPTIGVIDTLFHQSMYFSDWVSYHHMVNKEIETNSKDFEHGSAVSSLIVDGPAINPELDDGCGRFRVRHFGVATDGPFSTFTILKSIQDIVRQNRDIKVWNLSLGSSLEINQNFVSPEGAELDRIQSEYDVIFVVAGTNKPRGENGGMRLGAPADSLNSIVVNAVDFSGVPVSYKRVGPVLSFFHKPDISYYGGDVGREITVFTPDGKGKVSGTSFAAPWISRKLAYLIHKLGFTREVAKALLIDASAGWERKDDVSNSIGYGVVPKRIEDIVQTSVDEIRFIMTGVSDSYETYTYNIPVPVYDEKQPFYARATLCYFPKCSRDQGVDYTSTEMDIHFGRVKEGKGRAQIKSINANTQSDEGFNPMTEGNARKLYRKWDNIKHINDVVKKGGRPRKVYGSGMWGLSVKTKERLRPKNGKGLQFGVVVTLKEMNGKNRIDDFIKLCTLRGWIVNQIRVENQVEVYNRAEEDVIFD